MKPSSKNENSPPNRTELEYELQAQKNFKAAFGTQFFQSPKSKPRSYSTYIALILSFLILIGSYNFYSNIYLRPKIVNATGSIARPTHLRILCNSRECELNWKDNSDNEEGFIIRYTERGSNQKYDYAIVSANQTKIKIDLVNLKSQKIFQVYSYAPQIESLPSEAVAVDPL